MKHKQLNMKSVLSLTGLVILITTVGCIVPVEQRHGYRGREHYQPRQEVIVGPPVILVHPPEIIIR
jgi:hypothetical protein